MNRIGNIRFLFSIVVLATLVGCTSSNTLDKDAAASMLVGGILEGCKGPSLFAQTALREGAPNDQLMRNTLSWLANLGGDSSVKVITSGLGSWGYGHQSTYTYDDRGHEIYVNLFTEDDNIRTQYIVQTCAFVPDKIDVLDISYLDEEKKRARVTYVIHWRISRGAQLMEEVGIQGTPGRGAFTLPQPEERRQPFERLDATGWRIAQENGE